MRWTVLLALACFCLAALAQRPEVYQTLPVYPPKTKIKYHQKGPKPNSKVPQKGGPATFLMQEVHPAALRILVRAKCGANPSRQELIDLARGRKGRAKVVDWEDVSGDKVELWAVVAVRTWERQLQLKPKDGKYAVSDNRIREDEKWHVERLVGPVGASCINEETLTRDWLWRTLQSLLNRRQAFVSQELES